MIDAVELRVASALLFELHRLGNRGLHLKRELVGLDARAQILVVGIIDAGERVQFSEQAEVLAVAPPRDARVGRADERKRLLRIDVRAARRHTPARDTPRRA